MHDEDNAIGLSVPSPTGVAWSIYGDKRLLDEVNTQNKDRCAQAVQASADEIAQAWLTQLVPQPDDFRAWSIAPTLASALSKTQELAPLFLLGDKLYRRADVTNRREWKFTYAYWFATTIGLCKTSGLWNYPITLGLVGDSIGDESRARVELKH